MTILSNFNKFNKINICSLYIDLNIKKSEMIKIKKLMDPYVLQEICKKSLKEFEKSEEYGKNIEISNPHSTRSEVTFDKRLIEILRKNLLEKYPFLYSGELKWIVSTAAGATGWLALLHTSLHEYLILFGCSNPTDGHSGRYRAAVYDTVLAGEMRLSEEIDPTITNVYLPGNMGILPRKKIKTFSIREGTWMLEYARGRIVTMIPTGVGDNLFSNFDYKSLWWTIKDYVKKLFHKRSERRAFLKNAKLK